MDRQEKIEKLKKFTQDPDWVLMQELILEHILPLKDVNTIDSTKSNDEIASEVRGRQLSLSGMTKFLTEAKILGTRTVINKPTSFK